MIIEEEQDTARVRNEEENLNNTRAYTPGQTTEIKKEEGFSDSDSFESYEYYDEGEIEHWCAIPSCRKRFKEQSPSE